MYHKHYEDYIHSICYTHTCMQCSTHASSAACCSSAAALIFSSLTLSRSFSADIRDFVASDHGEGNT